MSAPSIEFFAFLLFDILGELSLSKGPSSGYAKKLGYFRVWLHQFKKWKLVILIILRGFNLD